MNSKEIQDLAIKQLSKETRIADYFVRSDIPDEFVERCIQIALQQGKNNFDLDVVSDWLPFKDNIDIFDKTDGSKLRLKFESGKECMYNDKQPFEEMTHFKVL